MRDLGLVLECALVDYSFVLVDPSLFNIFGGIFYTYETNGWSNVDTVLRKKFPVTTKKNGTVQASAMRQARQRSSTTSQEKEK